MTLPSEPLSESLNEHDDRMVDTTGRHGADIASQRADWLDVSSALFAATRMQRFGVCHAVDLGTGLGAHTAVLSRLGVETLAIDLCDQTGHFDYMNGRLHKPLITFFHGKVQDMPDRNWPQPIDLFYSQRTISYLPYAEALTLFQTAARHSTSGTRFFVSAGGLLTEYSEDYPHRALPVEARFSNLSEDMANKHHIYEKQCLYTPDELAGLLRQAGLQVKRCERSDFGNAKVMAVLP